MVGTAGRRNIFLCDFLKALKLALAQPLNGHPIFWYHNGIKSSSMQFWSRFSKDAFVLGMGSLVCLTAPHCLRTSLPWSRKDSCCSPLRLQCACPCTITAFSWRHSLFGKTSQRSDLPQGVEVPGEAPESTLQLCSDWSQRLSHQQPPLCFLREFKTHLVLALLMPLQFLVAACE